MTTERILQKTLTCAFNQLNALIYYSTGYYGKEPQLSTDRISTKIEFLNHNKCKKLWQAHRKAIRTQ